MELVDEGVYPSPSPRLHQRSVPTPVLLHQSRRVIRPTASRSHSYFHLTHGIVTDSILYRTAKNCDCAHAMETIISVRLRHLRYPCMSFFKKHIFKKKQTPVAARKLKQMFKMCQISVSLNNSFEIAVCGDPFQII